MATAKLKSGYDVHRYDVHPGVALVQSAIAGLKQKTGHTIEEWIKLVAKEGPPTEKGRREWLKARHGWVPTMQPGSSNAPWAKVKTVTLRLTSSRRKSMLRKCFPAPRRACVRSTKDGSGRKGLSLPDHSTAVPKPRFCSNKTHNSHSD